MLVRSMTFALYASSIHEHPLKIIQSYYLSSLYIACIFVLLIHYKINKVNTQGTHIISAIEEKNIYFYTLNESNL